jgi:putative nucleotidyltransferase with HDIG domain
MSVPERLLEGIDRLEPLPFTLQKLVTYLDKPEVETTEIVQIIELDGAVAANILRMANSARFGGRFEITSLRDAVERLGTSALLEIALGAQMRSLETAAPLYDLTEDDLWLHGAAASLAVKAIIKETRNLLIPSSATIAALLHDIGKLIMVRYMKADVSALVAICREKQVTFVEAERELFGCDHAEVGAAMAKKWNFPPEITFAIERHHQVPVTDPNPTLDVVMLANLVAKTIGVGLGMEGLNLRIEYGGSRDRLGLTVEGFERACVQTAFWLKDVKKNYGIRG